MRALQHEVIPVLRDEPLLLLRVLPPQHEHQVRLLLRQRPDRRVREHLPTFLAVRVRLVRANRQRRVEHQHALRRPLVQVPVRRFLAPQVVPELFVNITQARRNLDPLRYGEAQPHRLTVVVVRVLPEDDHLHVRRRARVEGSEHVLRRREHLSAGAPLALQEGLQVPEVLLLELRL
eukprot:21121-Pelagococcus_subviridis.AAC.16